MRVRLQEPGPMPDGTVSPETIFGRLTNHRIQLRRRRQRHTIVGLVALFALLGSACTTEVYDETASPLSYNAPLNVQDFAVRVESTETVDAVEMNVPGVGSSAMTPVGGDRYEASLPIPACFGAVEFTVDVTSGDTTSYPPSGAFTHAIENLPNGCDEFNDGFAATFTVDTTSDLPDAVPGDGVCATSTDDAVQCSLRAAVMEANAKPGNDLIRVPVGRYALSLTGAEGTDSLTDSIGDLDITDSVTVESIGGTNASAFDFLIESNDPAENLSDDPSVNNSIVKVDANEIDRGFQVAEDTILRLRHLAVINGAPAGEGGAVANRGTLVLDHVALVDNTAITPSWGAGGGAILNEGILVVDDSIIAQNIADTVNAVGGGVLNRGGTASFNRTLFAYNSARFGSAIQNTSGSTMAMTNVTVFDHRWYNDRSVNVVRIDEGATATLNFVTLAQWSQTTVRLLSNSGDTKLYNSALVGSATHLCSGVIVSHGGNMTDGPCTLDSILTPPEDFDYIDESLLTSSTLEDEGGFSPVYVIDYPSAGSSLFDPRDKAVWPLLPFTDQRGEGFPRKIDGDGDGSASADPGAYEHD